MLILDSVVRSVSYEGNIKVPNHSPNKSTQAKIWSTCQDYERAEVILDIIGR